MSCPPGAAALLPMAALAGPALHLANAMVDPAADAAAGLRTLATTLGEARSIHVLTAVQLLLFGLGWLTLALIGQPGIESVALATVGSGLVALGVALSASASERRRSTGWMVQAVAVACMGVAWLGAAVTRSIPD